MPAHVTRLRAMNSSLGRLSASRATAQVHIARAHHTRSLALKERRERAWIHHTRAIARRGGFPPHCAPDPSPVSFNSLVLSSGAGQICYCIGLWSFYAGNFGTCGRNMTVSENAWIASNCIYIYISYRYISSKDGILCIIEIRMCCYWDIKLD